MNININQFRKQKKADDIFESYINWDIRFNIRLKLSYQEILGYSEIKEIFFRFLSSFFS